MYSCFSALLFSILVTISNTCYAKNDKKPLSAIESRLPLWEAGVGFGNFNSANYPGSAERTNLALALPYVVYRGDILRVGDGSARAVLVDNDNYSLDLSFAASLPSRSEDSTVREGMPELDFIAEIGPQLILHLNEYDFGSSGVGRLDMRLQARAAFNTSFDDITDRGFVFEPQLAYKHIGLFSDNSILNITLSSIWGTERLHDYFYEVDSQFATQNRSIYDAKSGYVGSVFNIGMSFQASKNVRVLVGGSANYHAGAANEDSPLFEKKLTFGVGIFFVWRLYESEQKAKH